MERKPNTLRALVDIYARKRLRRKAASTRLKYLYAVDHWSDMLGREPLLTDLNDDAVAEFQDQLIDLTGLAEDTTLAYVKKILALWRFAFHQRWRWKWPEVELIEPADILPIAWSAGQLKTLFAALRSQTGFIGCVPAADWWTCQHWLFWHTSERLSAVMGLTWNRVDMDSGFVEFPAANRKGKRRASCYEVGAQCLTALRKIQAPRRELVLPFPYDKSLIWLRYKAILRSVGLPADRKHMFHCLRKSVASHMEAAGHDSTDTLGHSDRRVTKKH